MGRFWLKDERTKNQSEVDNNDSDAKADELHQTWSGLNSFPISWSLIDRDKKKLRSIFHFFFEMQTLLGSDAAESVRDLLDLRLRARWGGATFPDLSDLPDELKKEIKLLSESQVAAFQTLEKEGLVSPAFELFVSGSLTSHRKLYMTRDLSEPSIKFVSEDRGEGEFEPDGYAFFYWAEFAFLASSLGFELDAWIQFLPVLLRSERIYALCWGQPEVGFIPGDRILDDYNPGEFKAIHPCEAKCVFSLTSAASLVELEAEATNSARFAFPDNFKPSKEDL